MEAISRNTQRGGSEQSSGAANGGPQNLEYEELPNEPETQNSKPETDSIEFGENEDLPELAVECLDTVNQLVCKWGYKVSALSKKERADLKSFLFRQSVIQSQGHGYQATEYEMYLASIGEDLMKQEDGIAMTPDEKTRLQTKISRVMKEAKIKVNNPWAALWGTLAIIMLTRLLPMLTNLLDRVMNKKDKPARELGKLIKVERENKNAA